MSERRGRSRSATPSPPNEEEYRYEGEEEEEEEEEEEGVREKTVDRRVEFKMERWTTTTTTTKRNGGSGIINARDFARKTCVTCGTSETVQWRKGEGGVDLCNACGVRRRRQMLKQAGNITNSVKGKRRKTRRTNNAQTAAIAYGRGRSSAYDEEEEEVEEEEEEEEDQHEQQYALWRERKPQFPKFINDIVEAVRSAFASSTSNWKNEDQRIRAAEKIANKLCMVEEELYAKEGVNDDIEAKAARQISLLQGHQQRTIIDNDIKEEGNAVPLNHMLGYDNNHAIQEMMRSILAQSNRARPSSSANDGTFEDEDRDEDSDDGDGFRIQDLIENHAQPGSKTDKTSPDIVNSIEKEQIVKAIQEKYWSSGGEDGLAIGRCLLGE